MKTPAPLSKGEMGLFQRQKSREKAEIPNRLFQRSYL
jgi:hypothetical protein